MSRISRLAPKFDVFNPLDTNNRRLVDYSPNDKPWDVHRAQADGVEEIFAGGRFHHKRWAERLHECSAVLGFAWEDDPETGESRLRLRTAGFCRVRLCPVCQWRRSMKHKARLLERLPAIQSRYPKHRWLFLTLTVRNCPVEQLRDEIKRLTRGFTNLRRHKNFPAVGWIRTVEVTRGKDGSAHPHLHVLLLVPPSYFRGGSYLKTADWVRLWRKAMRLDYDPVVDVRTVKPNTRRGKNALESAIAEIAKYSTKPGQLTEDDEWLRVYAEQTHRLRFVDSGGVLRGILADDYDDLIHIDDGDDGDGDGDGEPDLYFAWDRPSKHYIKDG